MVCNTASLDRMAHASKKDGDMLIFLTKATQKDSSTMRLISMITMVYLPGAFVAVRTSCLSESALKQRHL